MTRLLIITFLLHNIHVIGQAPGTFVPQNLGTSINSPYDDINPVISPDGKRLFFARVNHPANLYGAFDSQDIWYSTHEKGVWTDAKRLDNLNLARHNAVLAVSQDGNALLLQGVFTKNGFWRKRGFSLAFKTGDNWSVPIKMRVPKFARRNRGLYTNASLSSDGSALVMSFSKIFNGKRPDLYISTKKRSGKWKRPQKLKGVNTYRSEISPFITPDHQCLYFSSNRHNKGEFRIYKAERAGSGWRKWKNVHPLGDSINLSSWNAYFKTNPKASLGYFSSNQGGSGKADIYSVKLYEENPFIVVSGKVVHQQTRVPFTGKRFQFRINGVLCDSVNIDPASASYKVWLPLRNDYHLEATSDVTTSKQVLVEAKQLREFSAATYDLPVLPLPYVDVRILTLIEGTDTPVPASILLNNQTIDSLIQENEFTSKLRLNHGNAYQFQAIARKFESTPITFDLTNIHEYIDTSLVIYLTKEKIAVLRGKVINSKTHTPIASNTRFAISVTGEPQIVATIDSINSTYEVRLPFGKLYEVSASVRGFYPTYYNITTFDNNVDVIEKDLDVSPVEVGQSIRLNNIFFATGKSILKPESFVELDRVVNFLSANTIDIEIAGHTDNVGKAASNNKLSQNRANAVVKYLVSKGIPASRLKAKGYGSAKPVADNKTKEGRDQNRRVEFTILAE